MDSSIKPFIDATTYDMCWIKSNASSNVYTYQKNDAYLELIDNCAGYIAAGVVMTIESIGGSIMNLLVIIALLRNPQLRNEYITPFIISNATTDFLFSTITLPTVSIFCFLRKWPNIPCSWHSLIGLGTWICSAWNLLGVALIRCYSIHRKTMSTSKCFKFSSIIIPVLAWIISFCILAPTFFEVNGQFGLSCDLQACILVNVDSNRNSLDYGDKIDRGPNLLIAGQMIIVGLIFLCLNFATYWMVARQSRILIQKMDGIHGETLRKILEKEKKVGKMMAIISITFMVVFMMAPIIRMIDFGFLRTRDGWIFHSVVTSLIVIINPLIYIICCDQYKKEIKNVMEETKSVVQTMVTKIQNDNSGITSEIK